MNYFLSNEEEINLIKFIAKYQYLDTNNAKYFFRTKKYYKKRITSLVEKQYLKRIKTNLVLGPLGIEYCKLLNCEYTKLNRNGRYFSRLLYISDLATYYYNSKEIEFTPSFSMKDKQVFTATSRKYIGILTIDGIEHLIYHISKESDIRYIKHIQNDIQKERQYKNIIILVNDISRIEINDFAYGNNEILIVEDNKTNREKLKYIHRINWSRIINDYFWTNISLSEYGFCDYTDHRNKYISTFYYLDTEKINKIKQFLRENNNKNATIICTAELKDIIIKEIPNAHYITVDIDKYIDKEQKVYD